MSDSPRHADAPDKASVTAVWDCNVESLSLGGLIVLRQEMELLARKDQRAGLHLILNNLPDSNIPLPARRMLREVFCSSLPCAISTNVPAKDTWPPVEALASEGFSYKSLSRIRDLWEDSGQQPILHWPGIAVEEALAKRGQFAGEIYTAHLKQILKDGDRASNASMADWMTFLRSVVVPGKKEFMLMGLDEIPAGIYSIPGIHSASTHGLNLAAQLCFIGISSGFIGMASGVCQAAIFSRVPYVIFKHPDHHADEMQRELGDMDSFPFALPKQKLWRKLDTASNLSKALSLIEQQ